MHVSPNKISFLQVFLLLSSSCVFVTGCMTPNNQQGVCVNILECQFLLDFIRENSNAYAISFLQNSTCGFDGIYPLVCCPTNPDQTNSNTDSSTSTLVPVTVPDSPGKYPIPKGPQCGLSNIVYNNKVVNGDPARLGEFPWMVALGYRNTRSPNEPKWLCAGTLITDKHVLTAAHCVNTRSDLYLARLGDLDLFSDDDGAQPIDIPIDRVVIHEDFNAAAISNDIAIIYLSQKVSYGNLIRPICLPSDESLRTQTFVRYYPFVAGWGTLYFDGPVSTRLQVVMLPVVSNDQCKQSYINFKNTVIDDNTLCAGYVSGGKDACQGDSGGPLMLARMQQDIYLYYQIGIVSYGFKCAEPGFPGVYTRVTAYLQWIENNIG